MTLRGLSFLSQQTLGGGENRDVQRHPHLLATPGVLEEARGADRKTQKVKTTALTKVCAEWREWRRSTQT